jgi:hypothetical protein
MIAEVLHDSEVCLTHLSKSPYASVKWDVAEGGMTGFKHYVLVFQNSLPCSRYRGLFPQGPGVPPSSAELRMVELYLHFTIHLCGVVPN